MGLHWWLECLFYCYSLCRYTNALHWILFSTLFMLCMFLCPPGSTSSFHFLLGCPSRLTVSTSLVCSTLKLHQWGLMQKIANECKQANRAGVLVWNLQCLKWGFVGVAQDQSFQWSSGKVDINRGYPIPKLARYLLEADYGSTIAYMWMMRTGTGASIVLSIREEHRSCSQ